jgi:uncharacterized HAD superfamily protein
MLKRLKNWFLYISIETTTIPPTTPLENRRVLVVDDSCNAGKRMREAVEFLSSKGITDVDTLAVYTVPGVPLTYLGEHVPQPRMFEWNMFNHPGWIPLAGIDIDGVLCPDPPMDELAFPKLYEEYLRTAPCIQPIRYPVGAFVTSRLERYRDTTEEWLKKNGYTYKELIMSKQSSAQERRRLQSYAKDKAEACLAHPSWVLFIESSEEQASEIFAKTGKPVFCTHPMKFFQNRRPELWNTFWR